MHKDVVATAGACQHHYCLSFMWHSDHRTEKARRPPLGWNLHLCSDHVTNSYELGIGALCMLSTIKVRLLFCMSGSDKLLVHASKAV